MTAFCRNALSFRHAALLAMLLLTLLRAAGADPTPAAPSPLAGAVVLIIRHAEKPLAGRELTPAGQRRAQAYVSYFGGYKVDGQGLRLTHLFAASDTTHSHRPTLTLAPLSAALRLPVDTRFADTQPDALAADLRAHNYGGRILICWHHHEVPALLSALGASPDALLPHGKWPDAQFGWVIELHFDAQGRLSQSRRVTQHITF